MVLLVLAAGFLFACGTFAIGQAATGEFLPHDAHFLGMTAPQLCALHHCRIVHFMIHDRISFGGVLIAISMLYLWLAHVPLRQRESWAWWTLAASGAAGALSFLAYLGYGYLDTWHGLATLVLLPLFAGGLIQTRGVLQSDRRDQRDRRDRLDRANPRRKLLRLGPGRALLLLAGFGISVGGLAITAVGMTSVFVPQDLAFMAVSRDDLMAVNPHLIPLIAHDRAGFGGALVSFGVAMCGIVWCASPSRDVLRVLTVAGVAGFGSAVGVHLVIGYTSLMHLGPAVLGCAVFAAGLAMEAVLLRRFRRVGSVLVEPQKARGVVV
jgi:hypothetical protein